MTEEQSPCRHEFPPEIAEHEKHGQCCTKCEAFYTFEQIDGWEQAMRISAADLAARDAEIEGLLALLEPAAQLAAKCDYLGLLEEINAAIDRHKESKGKVQE